MCRYLWSYFQASARCANNSQDDQPVHQVPYRSAFCCCIQSHICQASVPHIPQTAQRSFYPSDIHFSESYILPGTSRHQMPKMPVSLQLSCNCFLPYIPLYTLNVNAVRLYGIRCKHRFYNRKTRSARRCFSILLLRSANCKTESHSSILQR